MEKDWIWLLVGIWYSSSIGFSLFLEKFLHSTLSSNDHATVLSFICLGVFIQNLSCLFGISLIFIISYLINQSYKTSSISRLIMDGTYTKQMLVSFLFASLLHFLAILTMNIMLTWSNIPCVHTIRTLEPLFAQIFVYFLRTSKKNDLNTEKWIGTILMIFGVILITWCNNQCHLFSIIVLLGILMNLLIVIRNFCIQSIDLDNIDEIHKQIVLYGISTLFSFIFMLIIGVSDVLLYRNGKILCFIGLYSFLSNSTSIIICSRVQLVSYSLLSILKRPVVILVSSIYMNSTMNLMMIIIGNFFIFLGILFYKINENIFRFLTRRKFLFLLFTFMLLLLLTYRNMNHSSIIQTKKEFPLFYWQSKNKHENFGDKLSYILVSTMVGSNISIMNDIQPDLFCEKSKLLAIGSIMDFACRNDVIWGSGILNPLKFPFYFDSSLINTLDIRAVRGPRTRNLLMNKYNLTLPKIYGDPALLLPYYLPSYKKSMKPIISILLILHYVDVEKKLLSSGLNQIVTVHTFLPWNELINLILESKFVISTALHGIVVAEAFGIPARLLKSPLLNLFKFHDYYEGTNRTLRYATTIEQAIQMRGEVFPKIDLTPLRNAFPFDKFR
ncbi:hypothetical protein I4U23_003633 [Adineta vaga]|nr:hypothetical protein I4U23_003633 [Adineta vaga]